MKKAFAFCVALLCSCAPAHDEPIYNASNANVRSYHVIVANADKRLCAVLAKTKASALVLDDAYAQMNIQKPEKGEKILVQGIVTDAEEIEKTPTGYQCYCRVSINRTFFDALQAEVANTAKTTP